MRLLPAALADGSSAHLAHPGHPCGVWAPRLGEWLGKPLPILKRDVLPGVSSCLFCLPASASFSQPLFHFCPFLSSAFYLLGAVWEECQ